MALQRVEPHLMNSWGEYYALSENLPRTGYSSQAAVVGAPTLRSDTTKLPLAEKIINTVLSTLSVSSEEQTVGFSSVW